MENTTLHHGKLDRSFLKIRKTKKRLKRVEKQRKDSNKGDTKGRNVDSSLYPRLTISTPTSETRVAAVSESSLYSIATSVRLLGLTEEEERMLMLMLQPEDTDAQGPPYRKTPRNSQDSGRSLSKIGSIQSNSTVGDRLLSVSAHSSKSHSGRQVRFQKSHTHEEEKAEQSALDLTYSRESTPEEKAEVHKVYNDLSMWRKRTPVYIPSCVS